MKNSVLFALTLSATIARAGIAADLPVRRVALFTSGVGYFERAAEVQDRETAELSFRANEMVDLIKSLVVVDEGGGTVSAVTYDARDPLERTLKSFSIDLTDNPDLASLLNRMRGVEIAFKTSSGEATGRVVGVEAQTVKEDETVLTRYWIKVFADGQIRSLPLEQLAAFSPTDPKLAQDLAAALATLAGNLDRDKKKVRLEFQGKGRRTVRIGYMLEAPVWKTSYRLVLGERDALLQGWAHVENTTDENWQSVKLTMVSGRPISFIQNLYDPIYLQRPEVRPELYAAAPPPSYEGVVESAEADEAPDVRPSLAPLRMKGLFAGRSAERRALMAAAPAPGISAESVAASVAAEATAQEAGELFTYDIREPVTLPRRQSAMLPIVNSKIGAEKVSIFNRQTNARYAYNGAEITNNTGLFLMQGPITVFDEGVYAGDARLSDTPRGEAKLISYALDLASEVRVEDKAQNDEITTLKIVNGVLRLTRRYESRTEYVVKNKREKTRRFLIEQAMRSGWDLVEPAKNVEKTKDAYRYRFDVGAGKAEKVAFVEQRLLDEVVGLTDLRDDRIEFYIRQRAISGAVRKALEKLAQMQRDLADIRSQRQDRERRVREISEEQQRIRENMKSVVKPSDSYNMWESKLVKQEKDLDALRAEIETLRAKEIEKERAVRDYVASLNVD
jgi:hypothetical protein